MFEGCWLGICAFGYDNVSTPVFDVDGNSSTFSPDEVSRITEIWRRVAEDYAPFNINVTTVNPGTFSDRRGLRVAIGGRWQDWYDTAAGGVSYRGSFTDSDEVNTVYVFARTQLNDPKFIADAASHESGHAFGLRHQGVFASNGWLVDEYNPGTSLKAPLMGNSYKAARSTWWNGPSFSVSIPGPFGYTGQNQVYYQDDMAEIARSDNGFGYRQDDHSDNPVFATPLAQTTLTPFVLGRASVSGSGIIGRTSDVDYFTFTTTGGMATLTVNVASVGANLDAVLELRNASGTLIARADPDTILAASVTANLAPGRYTLAVRSHGEYGDVGQYTVTGTIAAGGVIGGSSTVVLAVAGPPAFSDAPSHVQSATPVLLRASAPGNLPLSGEVPHETRREDDPRPLSRRNGSRDLAWEAIFLASSDASDAWLLTNDPAANLARKV